MRAVLTAPDQLQPGELYKYIRLPDGGFRFIELHPFGFNHVDMLQPGEHAGSAGTIRIAPDYWEYMGFGSVTCGCSWLDDDTDRITRLVNRPCR